MSLATAYDSRRTGCRCIREYVSYGVSVSGRRALTLFDVATDVRTFFILWHDPATTTIACFLMASIATPFLVYWASSHNFNHAIHAHRTFGDSRPTSCCERFHRNFYNAMSIPFLGVYLTSLQVLFWWFADIFMSACCQSRHRSERERLRCASKPVSGTRTMPLVMPPESARFMTVVELCYESIPQAAMQLTVYLRHSSPFFTLFDVCLSLSASLLNSVFNVLEIQYAARTRAMSFTDYLLYFMSGQIDDMLRSGVPVKRALRNEAIEECDITEYRDLYKAKNAMRNVRRVVETDTRENGVQGWKRVILPRVPDDTSWTLGEFEEIVRAVLALRRHPNVHVTLPHVSDTFADHFMSTDFQSEARASSAKRRRFCNVRSARCLNRFFGCCGTRPGDVACATNTQVLDDDLHRTGGCFSPPQRGASPGRDYRQRANLLMRSLDAESAITSAVVRHIVAFLVIGDLGMLENDDLELQSDFMRMVIREATLPPALLL